jgi:hypothetical protein
MDGRSLSIIKTSERYWVRPMPIMGDFIEYSSLPYQDAAAI